MKAAVINIRTDARTKSQAQKIADEFGFSLSSLVNGFLRNIVRTKTITFTTQRSEKPTPYLRQILKESQEDVHKGRVISFKDGLHAEQYIQAMIDDEQKAVQN